MLITKADVMRTTGNLQVTMVNTITGKRNTVRCERVHNLPGYGVDVIYQEYPERGTCFVNCRLESVVTL